MMYTTMTEKEKNYPAEISARIERETKMSESSSGDSDYGSVDDDTVKTPLMKMTYATTDDLEWDLASGKLKEYNTGCSLL